MKRFSVFNDLHIGSPYELMGLDVDLTTKIYPDTIGVSIGDVYDRKNVKKSLLPLLEQRLARHKSDFSGRYVGGNHELVPIELNPWIEIDGIGFMHGDILFWDYNKASQFRAKSPGAGWLKRSFVQTIDELRTVKPEHVGQDFFDRAEKYMKIIGCHTLICGHHHPKKVLKYEKSFGKIFILPRGINIIEA